MLVTPQPEAFVPEEFKARCRRAASMSKDAKAKRRPASLTTGGAPFPTEPGMYIWHSDAGDYWEERYFVEFYDGMPFVAVNTIPRRDGADGLEIVWALAPSNGTWYRVISPTASEPVHIGPARDYLIDGIAEKGRSLVIRGQRPKCGVSWLLEHIAVAVAGGKPVLGQFATKPSKVLLLDFNQQRETLSWRVRQIRDAMGVPQETLDCNLAIISLRGRDPLSHTDMAALSGICFDAYDLLVIDAPTFSPPRTTATVISNCGRGNFVDFLPFEQDSAFLKSGHMATVYMEFRFPLWVAVREES